MSEYESAAMWDLYLKSNEGIAIQTDYTSLFNILNNSDKDIYLTKVVYSDYDETEFPITNLFYPYVHKRTSFSHEQ